ncbi:MAG: leucyl aminopeptidase [Chakrabartia sp.]
MSLRFSAALPEAAPCVIVPIAKDGLATATLSGDAAVIDAAAKAARFSGDAGSIVDLHHGVAGQVQRLVLVGTGGESLAEMEKAGAAASARLLTSGETSAALDLAAAGRPISAKQAAHFAAGALLRSWRHDQYRTRLAAAKKPSLAELVMVSAPEGIEAAWAEQSAIIDGVALTRTLVTEPANILYPETFVARCAHLKDLGVEIEVLGEAEMRAAGMGALLGVAQGSIREPKLLVMRWDGTKGAVEKPVVFVGKGVTFDTGGISLKPPAGMEDMKWDMGGAGAVAGAMLALAGRKAKAHVVGICGLVENMPDGGAQRPGDVVTSMSGQTIEVINTDAEGRLVLCDAMTWVQQRFKPEIMVDLATLTGAMIISLGHEYGGLFANDDDLAAKLSAAGQSVGDKLWRFPIGAAYDKLIDSPIADMKNVGPREGGSITAAQFLQRFVDDGVKWAHLDIAGMVWAAKPGTLWDKGATGFGVRLLDRFVADNFEG